MQLQNHTYKSQELMIQGIPLVSTPNQTQNIRGNMLVHDTCHNMFMPFRRENHQQLSHLSPLPSTRLFFPCATFEICAACFHKGPPNAQHLHSHVYELLDTKIRE